MVDPICPACGKHEFEYRYIFSEGKTQEWKERVIQYKADGRNDQWIENAKQQFYDQQPCAIVFCTKCGYVIGVAK